ncbi:MAG: thioredoxin family protein [Candidatus Bathyarchaeia archaeon]
MPNVIEVTSSSWKGIVASSDKPVVVEFYTPTCPFCQRLAPVFEKLAGEYTGRLIFAKVDASTEVELASGYGIMGVPTLKFFCSGRPIGEVVGFVPEEELKAALEGLLKRYTRCVSESSPLYG